MLESLFNEIDDFNKPLHEKRDSNTGDSRTAFFIENLRWLLLFIMAFNSDKSNQFSVGGREFKSKGKKESLLGFHI